MYKTCLNCCRTMKGIRDYAVREHCDDCGGESLTEDSPARVQARRNLAEIYAAERPPLRFFS